MTEVWRVDAELSGLMEIFRSLSARSFREIFCGLSFEAISLVIPTISELNDKTHADRANKCLVLLTRESPPETHYLGVDA